VTLANPYYLSDQETKEKSRKVEKKKEKTKEEMRHHNLISQFALPSTKLPASNSYLDGVGNLILSISSNPTISSNFCSSVIASPLS
jgi:hypothetical protein